MKVGIAAELLQIFTAGFETDGTDYSKGVVIFTTNELGVKSVDKQYFQYVRVS